MLGETNHASFIRNHWHVRFYPEGLKIRKGKQNKKNDCTIIELLLLVFAPNVWAL